MGTMIGKICFIYYKHIISGVVKNKEYFLENVTNLGLPLPLMKPDFPTLTSPMFMVAGDWSTPTAAIAALQLKADGTLSWVGVLLIYALCSMESVPVIAFHCQLRCDSSFSLYSAPALVLVGEKYFPHGLFLS